MSSLNKATIIGRVGSDPEVRYLENGNTVAKFSIATSESYTNKAGEKVENTEWHRIEAWDKLAQIIEKYVKKGSLLYVEGKIKTDKYTDKDGTEKYSTSIRINEMKMLGSKPERSSENPEPVNPALKNAPKQLVPEAVDDDLPF